jgi:superfamily I DNA/RNA helicase
LLSGNQRQAVVDLATSRSGLHVVSAWAGAGKTTMASAAVGIMKGMGLDVLAVAPSNAAAEGLRREIGAASALTPESLHLAITNAA